MAALLKGICAVQGLATKFTPSAETNSCNLERLLFATQVGWVGSSGQTLDFIDLDLRVLPCCLAAMPILPDLQLP